jgi:Domain of unknown function (DUF6883)
VGLYRVQPGDVSAGGETFSEAATEFKREPGGTIALVKLPADSIISERKLREYLLTPRPEDDKSRFLALAGYSLSHWHLLEADLRRQIVEGDALLIRTTQYGDMYRINGRLTGPNGKVLDVTTGWIRLHATGETGFVTLVPDKEAQQWK